MRRLVLALFALGLVASAIAGAVIDSPFAGRRVLVIGIDGCRADALKKLIEIGRVPRLALLAATGTVTWNAFAGGPEGSEAVQETSSGPGWTTILTGVWRDRHGVA